MRGASHIRADLPNQDAIQWFTEPLADRATTPNLFGLGLPLVLAISDGHGSVKSFRSHIGSRLAVETTIAVTHDFLLSRQTSAEEFSTIKDLVQTHLPQRIVYAWLNAVQHHWRNDPLTEDDPEWESLLKKIGKTAQEKADLQATFQKNPEIAYGATLLTVIVTEWFVLYLQLGDGDILCVDAKGTVTRPLQRDQRLIANETTSLCTVDAWKECQIQLDWNLDRSIHQVPSLILLATDGYANSYPSEAEFLKIAPDYLDLIRNNGIAQVAQHLPDYLQETSEQGSGDDITVGILKRLDKSEQDLMYLQNQCEQQVSEQKRLGMQQKKISRAVFCTILWLGGISVLTGGNILGSFWLWSRFIVLDQRVESIQGQIGNLSQPPSQAPTPAPSPDPPPAAQTLP